MQVINFKVKEQVKQEDLFKKELILLLSRHNKNGLSNTPDFILADFLNDILTAVEKLMFQRDKLNNPKKTN